MVDYFPIQPPKVSIVLLEGRFPVLLMQALDFLVVDVLFPDFIRDEMKVIAKMKWR